MHRRTSAALALCLIGSAAGCVTSPAPPRNQAEMMVKANSSRPQEPAPPQKPKKKTNPDVYVAFGDLNAGQLAGANLPPMQANDLREKARSAYQDALNIDPNHKSALAGLAKLHAISGDHERAVLAYRKAAEKHPKDAALWHDMGLCHARNKEWGPAIDSMQKAHALDPDKREYGMTLGLTLARAGRVSESVQAMARVTTKAEAHLKVAQMLCHCGNPAQGRTHLQLALQFNPNLAPAQQMLAQLDAPAGEQTLMQAGGQVRQ